MADQLTEEKRAEYREHFDWIDKDGTGNISWQEIGKLMRSIGQNPTDAEIQALIDEFDKDGDKTLDFNEFITMVTTREEINQDPEEELKNAFRVFDHDGNGLITPDVLRRIMKTLGQQTLTDEEVDDMISEADVNGDGQINYEEFANCLSK